jgi:hypothetical protein
MTAKGSVTIWLLGELINAGFYGGGVRPRINFLLIPKYSMIS